MLWIKLIWNLKSYLEKTYEMLAIMRFEMRRESRQYVLMSCFCISSSLLVLISFHLEKRRKVVMMFTVGVLGLKEMAIWPKLSSSQKRYKVHPCYFSFMSKRIVVLSPVFYIRGLSFSSCISDFSLSKHCLHQWS